MTRFTRRIRPHVEAEIASANAAIGRGDSGTAFAHLERAHVLGQSSTRLHLRVHWLMLRWALRQRRASELVGQALRLLGAGSKTPFGLVPTGNTGGANVSPFHRMPIAPELRRVIDAARR